MPVGLFACRQQFAKVLVPTIILFSLYCVLVLFHDPTFGKHKFWKFSPDWGRFSLFFVAGAILLSLLTKLIWPELWLHFPNHRTRLWLTILLLYPIFSVIPQEFIFRVFFFHRYECFFNEKWVAVAVNALSFGLAHAFFGNWVAPVITGVGSILFADAYLKSKSLLWVSIQHSIWGNFAFTIGLGWFFFSGSIS